VISGDIQVDLAEGAYSQLLVIVKKKGPKKLIFSPQNLVETLGIEPRSESNLSPESTCVVCVLDWINSVHKQTLFTLRRL